MTDNWLRQEEHRQVAQETQAAMTEAQVTSVAESYYEEGGDLITEAISELAQGEVDWPLQLVQLLREGKDAAAGKLLREQLWAYTWRRAELELRV